jgi:hypothetical protein
MLFSLFGRAGNIRSKVAPATPDSRLSLCFDSFRTPYTALPGAARRFATNLEVKQELLAGRCAIPVMSLTGIPH